MIKMNTKVMFSSQRSDWETLEDLMRFIYDRWKIETDVAPVNHTFDALSDQYRWEGRVYCNPPYGREQLKWVLKALKEMQNYDLLKVAVFLLLVRTDTKVFRLCVDFANEILFFTRRIKFVGARHSAPFPSMLVVFRRERERLTIGFIESKDGRYEVRYKW